MNKFPTKKELDKKYNFDFPRELYNFLHYLNIEKKHFIDSNDLFCDLSPFQNPIIFSSKLQNLFKKSELIISPELIKIVDLEEHSYIGVFLETDGFNKNINFIFPSIEGIKSFHSFSLFLKYLIEIERESINCWLDNGENINKDRFKIHTDFLNRIEKKFVKDKIPQKAKLNLNKKFKINSQLHNFKIGFPNNWEVDEIYFNKISKKLIKKASVEDFREKMYEEAIKRKENNELGTAFLILSNLEYNYSNNDILNNKIKCELGELYDIMKHPFAKWNLVKNVSLSEYSFKKIMNPYKKPKEINFLLITYISIILLFSLLIGLFFIYNLYFK